MQSHPIATLTDAEVALVCGGDSWAGTPAGRAPAGPATEPALDQLPWAGFVGAILFKVIF